VLINAFKNWINAKIKGWRKISSIYIQIRAPAWKIEMRRGEGWRLGLKGARIVQGLVRKSANPRKREETHLHIL
jgi:hypothetical protein